MALSEWGHVDLFVFLSSESSQQSEKHGVNMKSSIQTLDCLQSRELLVSLRGFGVLMVIGSRFKLSASPTPPFERRRQACFSLRILALNTRRFHSVENVLLSVPTFRRLLGWIFWGNCSSARCSLLLLLKLLMHCPQLASPCPES